MEKWNANSNLWVVAWAGKRRHGYGGDEVEWKQSGDEQCHEPIDTKMGGGAGEAAAFDAAAATGASIAIIVQSRGIGHWLGRSWGTSVSVSRIGIGKILI